MDDLDPELIALIKSLARAAVSRDLKARNQAQLADKKPEGKVSQRSLRKGD